MTRRHRDALWDLIFSSKPNLVHHLRLDCFKLESLQCRESIPFIFDAFPVPSPISSSPTTAAMAMSDVELESEMDFEEDAPFLNDEERDEEDANADTEAPGNEQPDEPLPTQPRIKAARWQAKTPRTIVLLAAVLKFCLASSGMLLIIPIYRLIEDSLCHVHYKDDSYEIIDEMKCKVDGVQSRLASLIGWCGLVQSVMSEYISDHFKIPTDDDDDSLACHLSIWHAC